MPCSGATALFFILAIIFSAIATIWRCLFVVFDHDVGAATEMDAIFTAVTSSVVGGRCLIDPRYCELAPESCLPGSL